MRISSIRLSGIRCFADTGDIQLGPGCNILVGQNNVGKSTIVKTIIDWQIGIVKSHAEVRPGSLDSKFEITVDDISPKDPLLEKTNEKNSERYSVVWPGHTQRGELNYLVERPTIFDNRWPTNFVVPFITKRKAYKFDHNVSTAAHSAIDGTFLNLYARIDRVATPGITAHELYKAAVTEIVGVFITTRSSESGKQAGYYFDDDNFVTLDNMGDGVSEIVALVVELSLAEHKVFVLEEPETSLHPKALKALLNLIRESATKNQFIITTHSNIVVRELAVEGTRIFRVFRDEEQLKAPSNVALVENNPAAHRELLRELGYEFGDFDLHEGWLFLEEASAETIIRDVLIPLFAPTLTGRLRTFSASGVTNVEPSVSEFQRLITFIHLDPVYRDRLWIRVDGDPPGVETIGNIHKKFPYLAEPRAKYFSASKFEDFYPKAFSSEVDSAFSIKNKQERQDAKEKLLRKVVEWTNKNQEDARLEWEKCASEPIALLQLICQTLDGK